MAIINKIKRTARGLLPGFALGGYHFLLALAAAARYGFPSRKLKVIGVTGTNGKSTTIEFISAILKEAGYKVAVLSSIKFEVGEDLRINKTGNTMPGRFAVQSILARAAKAKCDYAILEVTSEGIKQHRHRFIDFTGAVFTNLTPEHIESHGGFDNYRKAKLKLFKAAKGFHAVNCDDENANYFLGFKAKRKFGYGFCGSQGIGRNGADYAVICAQDIKTGLNGARFSVGNDKFEINLAGEFNIHNALAAICCAVSQGVGMDACQRAISGIKIVPGRMEKAGDSPRVFVDFAFTPNALEKVYSALERDCRGKNGKLVCLLGACGGGRDKWKRPILGQIAAKHCGEIILTNEDPYDEDPRKIIDMVKDGAVGAGFKGDIHEIMDRREAIRKALELTGADDVAILTGKGSMPWTFLANGEKIPWNEKEIVAEELAKLREYLESRNH
ncbi:MAG: UDP-N-acetylmuramoyl-L-alanyl-D-glutamate--2,6-diaminopimelate ligase [Candidatus Nealsonbacteria bacterium DGGOD1a]|jgi:UDP-N-acetylmuramyl-tripeptide synthetases|nr:MAG: UDP-N-acetylmuramoyl-L-alanyl-D-glutamate--2,6-diaminopimelate ligase [Candidatus Nealsonbacteria bacterium DGGOD1a]